MEGDGTDFFDFGWGAFQEICLFQSFKVLVVGSYSFLFHLGIIICGMEGMDCSNSSFSLALPDSCTASYIPTRCKRESSNPKLRKTRLLKDFCSDSGTTVAIAGTRREFSRSIMDRA